MARGIVARAADLARRAAVDAGDFLHSRLRGRRTITSKAGVGNLVTEMDLASERRIVRAIRREFPGHEIVAEEGGRSSGTGARWYVDPLDGTTNYAHGFPVYSVSIGFELDGVLEAGAVYGPGVGELFTAVRGRGARRNGRRVAASRQSRLDRALLCTGYSYRWETKLANLRPWGAFIRRAQAVRRVGSAALDLCWTAAGVYDGFWEMALGPWDIAAAIVVGREAGLTLTGLRGEPVDLSRGDVLAAGGRLHGKMLDVLRTEGGLR